MKINIIGAGIGGLTTAIALQQKGFEVCVYESFPEFKRLGAGIVLANNAMQVYRRLGLSELIYQRANRISKLIISDESLKALSSVNLEAITQKIGVSYAAIHRASLQELLVEQLPSSCLKLNKKLVRIEEEDHGVQLYFKDGSSSQADLVIGADGIHSAVRENLFKDATKVRKAKQICWRGIAQIELETSIKNEIKESWGNGTRFGIVPIATDAVYWFAVANYKSDFRKEFQGVKLEDLFSNYNPLVKKIIQHTNKEQIIINEIIDILPMQQWHSKRVCLIGDAAHATTPNMGQGACQAIEDSLALSLCLETETQAENAFRKFQQLRKKKANQIIQQSWTIGQIAHLENKWGRLFRNALLKMTPDFLSAQQTKQIARLNY